MSPYDLPLLGGLPYDQFFYFTFCLWSTNLFCFCCCLLLSFFVYLLILSFVSFLHMIILSQHHLIFWNWKSEGKTEEGPNMKGQSEGGFWKNVCCLLGGLCWVLTYKLFVSGVLFLLFVFGGAEWVFLFQSVSLLHKKHNPPKNKTENKTFCNGFWLCCFVFAGVSFTTPKEPPTPKEIKKNKRKG